MNFAVHSLNPALATVQRASMRMLGLGCFTAEALAEQIDFSACHEGRPTLLCMSRAVFNSDIGALRTRTNLNYATVSAAAFESLLAPHVPPSERLQTYFNAAFAAAGDGTKRKMLDIAHRFLNAAIARHPIHAVAVANTDYWQDEVLKDVCRMLSLPFLVLCRENYAVGHSQELLKTRIRQSKFRFRGTGVAVASDITRDTMLASGAYEPDSVSTVGWPRFDTWLDRQADAVPDEKLIVLIAYQQDGYLAPRNFTGALNAFVKAARQSGTPERFVIKLKKMAHLKDLLLSCPRLLFSGVKIVASGPLDDLLRRAAAVVGYNTTGVLEAYLTSAAVVVPWWDDAVRPGRECLISALDEDDRRTAHFPLSPDELCALLLRAARGDLPALGDRQERLMRFRKFVWIDMHSSASARFEAFARRYIAYP